uniref:C-type lectin domain-containing protein n=1 Tax=Amphilophus citrinellus TaxID=61819 RepID=A0A3Q0SJK1_AMPCI
SSLTAQFLLLLSALRSGSVCKKESIFHFNFRTQRNPEFHLVDKNMSWSDAQKYCRENFLDLATVTNHGENQQVQEKAQKEMAWIGLHRDPNIYWSDGSKHSFTNWASGMNPFGGLSVICAALDGSGRWKMLSCEGPLPFVCYMAFKNIHTP